MGTLMHRAGRNRSTFVALVLAGLFLAAPVRGQEEPASIGLLVQPAQVEPDDPIDDRRFAQDILVANQSDETFRIEASLAELGHDLDGTPRNTVSAEVERAFSLNDESFTLGSGEQKTLRLEGAIPGSDRSIYLSVVTEFAPVGEEAPPTVRTRRQIVSQYLLRGPTPWKERVRVVDIGVLPGAEGAEKLTVYASVKNIGNVHVRPRGRLRIFRGKQSLGTVRLTSGENLGRPGAVIPGYTRRLTGLWKPPPGLTGLITFQVLVSDPDAEGTGTVRFAGGAARAPAARIAHLSAVNEEGAAFVTATVTNTGSIAITPLITLTAAQGTAERARQAFPRLAIEPGSSREIEWRPELALGLYRITAEARQGTTLLDQRTTGLRLVPEPPPPKRAPWLLLAWLMVLALVAALLFVLLKRKGGRREALR